jgi:aspartate kinase
VKFLSYDEASELAYFGAKVLHPRSILPAIKRNIPVRVKSFLNPADSGTEIVGRIAEGNELLRAITFKKNIILVDIVSTRMLGQYGFLAMVFKIFSDLKISVDVVASSEVSISLTLDNNVSDLEKLKKELEKIAVVNINSGKTIISLIGNVSRSSEILNKTCSTLAKNYVNVQMISQGASKVNISFIVNDNEAEKCIKELHKVFFEELK